jgi:D-hydroxyproline dehydrogenase subunit alpha
MTRSEPFDVLIVGAGPAGIAAACAAASGKAKVAVVDDNPAPGGQIWRGGLPRSETRQARDWLTRFAAAGATAIHGGQVVAHPEPGMLLADLGGRPLELRYEKLIVATGARERFLPFPGWTLPNVMGAGGLPALVKSGFPVQGKRVAVAGSGPLLFSVAECLRRHGAIVPLIAEQASWGTLGCFSLQLPWLSPGKLFQGIGYKLRLLGTRYLAGCWPVAAHGPDCLKSVTFRWGQKTWHEPCDFLACGFGLVPNLELPRLLGCEIRDGGVRVDQWQETTVPGVYCAGELTGVGGADLAIAEGQVAGNAAIGQNGLAARWFGARGRGWRFARALERGFALRDELRDLATAETLVCRCEDVPRQRLQRYASWRAAKLQTRCGMGACQGRVCGAAAEFLFGWKHESVRPPIFPASLGSLAGDPDERTP